MRECTRLRITPLLGSTVVAMWSTPTAAGAAATSPPPTPPILGSRQPLCAIPGTIKGCRDQVSGSEWAGQGGR